MKNLDAIQSNIENLTFGVEFETCLPVNQCAGSGGAIQVGGYHHGRDVVTGPHFNGAYWKAEADGSIMAGRGYRACEFVSPVLKGEAGIAHLIFMVQWLNTIGAKVNRSCGFHIHVGISGFVPQLDNDSVAEFVEKLARVSSFYSNALYAQTGTLARESGYFCRKPGAQYRDVIKRVKKSKALNDLSGIDRYQMLNLTNVTRNRTVEFRCFAGTLNIEKVLVHLFSVLGVCRVAGNLETVPAWESKAQTGHDSVWNLLKVRPMRRLVCCRLFVHHWDGMVEAALVMALKYDAAKNLASNVRPLAPALPNSASATPGTDNSSNATTATL